MKLTGRTILITGGSAGIGLAFALKFLDLGNEVIVTGSCGASGASPSPDQAQPDADQ